MIDLLNHFIIKVDPVVPKTNDPAVVVENIDPVAAKCLWMIHHPNLITNFIDLVLVPLVVVPSIIILLVVIVVVRDLVVVKGKKMTKEKNFLDNALEV